MLCGVIARRRDPRETPIIYFGAVLRGGKLFSPSILRGGGRNNRSCAGNNVHIAGNKRGGINLNGTAGNGNRKHIARINIRIVRKRFISALYGNGSIGRLRNGKLVRSLCGERVRSCDGIKETGNVRKILCNINVQRLRALAGFGKLMCGAYSGIGKFLAVCVGGIVLRAVRLGRDIKGSLVNVLSQGFLSLLLHHYNTVQHIFSPFSVGRRGLVEGLYLFTFYALPLAVVSTAFGSGCACKAFSSLIPRLLFAAN